MRDWIGTSEAGIIHPPEASALLQSLRSIGYTPAAALADIVDNSIAAEAKSIDICVASRPDLAVTILDDGCGMTEEALINAMKFGSRDPRLMRDGMDLGRFGLGLKTASISQCRRFTVATLAGGKLSLARWDLDECDQRNSWWLERPSIREIPTQTLTDLESQGHGTAVIWEKLDRLKESGGEKALLDAADHLALCFHRFLSLEAGKRLSISLNSTALPSMDPFLTGHLKGQALHTESIEIEGHKVTVTPFVLPFPSRLKGMDVDRMGGKESLKTGHGFYIYRGYRLIVPGGWFRIVPSDDLIRLARIRVDVPTALDHLWKVDVKKAAAEPPQPLRPHLKRIVTDVTLRSRKVYHFKGSPGNAERVQFWSRHELRDRSSTWRINRNHPYVANVLKAHESPAEVERLLSLLEDSVPLHEIHLHTSNDLPVADAAIPSKETLQHLAERIVTALPDRDTISRFLNNLHATEPFSRSPGIAREIAETLLHEH